MRLACYFPEISLTFLFLPRPLIFVDTRNTARTQVQWTQTKLMWLVTSSFPRCHRRRYEGRLSTSMFNASSLQQPSSIFNIVYYGFHLFYSTIISSANISRRWSTHSSSTQPRWSIEEISSSFNRSVTSCKASSFKYFCRSTSPCVFQF